MPDASTSAELFIEMADQAMYRAKEQGRNQVVLARPGGGDPSCVTASHRAPLQQEENFMIVRFAATVVLAAASPLASPRSPRRWPAPPPPHRQRCRRRERGRQGVLHPAPAGPLQALDQGGAAGGHRLGRRHRGQAHPDQRPRRRLRQPGADPGQPGRRQGLAPPWWRSRPASTWPSSSSTTSRSSNPPAAAARRACCRTCKEPVMAYGYPTGGNSLSITKGIVSRIEFVPYNSPARACASRSTPPSTPATAAARPSPATR